MTTVRDGRKEGSATVLGPSPEPLRREARACASSVAPGDPIAPSAVTDSGRIADSAAGPEHLDLVTSSPAWFAFAAAAVAAIIWIWS